jgi:hypothetical protein
MAITLVVQTHITNSSPRPSFSRKKTTIKAGAIFYPQLRVPPARDQLFAFGEVETSSYGMLRELTKAYEKSGQKASIG